MDDERSFGNIVKSLRKGRRRTDKKSQGVL